MASMKHKNVSVWPQTHRKLERYSKKRRLGSLTNTVDTLVSEALAASSKEPTDGTQGMDAPSGALTDHPV